MLKTIGIREAKAHFSEYVALAHGGDDVIVTDRGRPVVRLVGIRAREVRSEDDVLRQLDADGILELGVTPAIVRRSPRKPATLKKPEDIVALVRAQRR
jgi:prevent-host-death family protein